ncbi:MFS general substrate transporter [Periconia macrospinosa]|uniref:MFS general substrate transporter n=1 Tax=Periconia macrospinosa TaxID=97972 RepID=A0A2V1DD89_9PLEO|nr:MFS general substrate transporter [Periconia macrospinosa]
MSAITLQSTCIFEDASSWYNERFYAESHDTVAAILPVNVERKGDERAPPPDGGTTAWLQVLGSWMLFFFGVFQTYYEVGSLFRTSSTNISWIGSIQALAMLGTGAFVGPIYDRGGFRWLLVVGSVGVVVRHIVKTYWQAILTQGLMVGIGGGCLYVPAVAIMPTYFTSKLGLTIGIAASGSSTGGIIYPIMFYKLIDRIGFAWTVRILGFTALMTLTIPFYVMRMRVEPAKVVILLFSTLRSSGKVLVTDTSLAFYLVPTLNAGSVFGRTVPNWLSDRIGPLNVIAPSAFVVGAHLFCNIVVDNVAGIVATTWLLGFFSGVFVALPPAVFVALTQDKSKIGTRIGMRLALAGLGVLAAGPGGGAILGGTHESENFEGLWIFAGTVSMSAGAIFTALRV